MTLEVKAPDGATVKYNGLQILRTLACLFVLVHHVMMQIAVGGLDASFPLWLNGVAGVDIFFVLSGFVMVVSSQRLVSRKCGWRTFARRRFIRIAPMYWLLTVAFFCAVVVRYFHEVALYRLFLWFLGSLAFLPVREPFGLIYPVLGVGWTLVFEMFFYGVFTIALFLRRDALWFVGSVLVVATTASIFRQASWPSISYYLDPIVLEFLAGMLVAKLCQRNKTFPPALGLFVAVLGLGYIVLSGIQPLSMRAIYFGIPATVVVYAVASMEPWLHKVPPVLLALADVSFVLYLVHEPVIQVITKSMKVAHYNHAIAAFCFSLVSSVLLAVILRLYVEVPLQQKLKCGLGWSDVR